MPLDQSEVIAQAGDLRNEVLVHFIRRTRHGEPELYSRLFQELVRRINGIVRAQVRRLRRFSAQDIGLKVEIEIIKLVLAENPSRATDVLEVAFAEVVQRRALDAVRRHKSSPQGRRGEILPDAGHEDGDQVERPIELAADGRPGPEGILLKREDEALGNKSFRKARRAVKDPRDFKAAMLHHGEGLPIRSSDPAKPDLQRHFPERPAQIKHRLARAMRAMRKAFGV